MTIESQTDAPVIESSSTEMINIGNRLKAKRMELKLDERRVASELKITIEQVRALEANNFDYFRSVTFSRGFLKSYCRLLELNSAEIIGAFDSAQMAVEPTIKPIDKVDRQTHLGDPIIIVISVVIVAILVFLVFWWPATSSNNVASIAQNDVSEVAGIADQSSKPPAPKAADDVASSSADAASPSVNDTAKIASKDKVPEAVPQAEGKDLPQNQVESIKNTDGVVTGLSAETKAILKEAGVSPDAVVLATQKAENEEPVLAQQQPAYSNDIVISFDADCWTEVRDSTNKILYSGVKSAGSKLELTGSAPYRVVLGFAKGVSSLQYKGKAFDFSPFTRQDLARFELK